MFRAGLARARALGLLCACCSLQAPSLDEYTGGGTDGGAVGNGGEGGALGASGSDEVGGAGAAGQPGGDEEAGAGGMTSEPDPAVSFTTYEAEALKLLGTKANVYEDPAASGGKGVAYLQGLGDGVSLQGGSRAGSTLMIRYAATEDGHLSVYVNGRKMGLIHFLATGASSGEYADAYLPVEIPENAWVTLQRDASDAYVSLDYIGIGPPSIVETYEAEDGAVLGDAGSHPDRPPPGSIWVGNIGNEGDGIRIEGVRAGVGLVVRHAGPYLGGMSVYVNGTKRGAVPLAATGWDTAAVSSLMTEIPDQATIELRRDAGDVQADLDWVQVMAPTSLRAEPLTNDGPAYALLEPKSGILHGAGDSPAGFSDYWNALELGHRPALFVSYASFMGADAGGDIDFIRSALAAYPESVIPVVMLWHSYEVVTDAKIETLIAGFQRWGRPAYLVNGYGFESFGYEAATYRSVFRRVTQRLRDAGLEVATVWMAGIDGDASTSEFYPGDDVVDWWGMPLTKVASFSASGWIGFAERATAHRKPLMVVEATPSDIGVSDGQASYDAWFKPFFGFAEQHQIKAFCYRNGIFGTAPDEKDARIETNPVVLDNYRTELRRPVYIHASLEADFRSKLGPTGPAR